MNKFILLFLVLILVCGAAGFLYYLNEKTYENLIQQVKDIPAQETPTKGEKTIEFPKPPKGGWDGK